jgi:hypothetical protein
MRQLKKHTSEKFNKRKFNKSDEEAGTTRSSRYFLLRMTADDRLAGWAVSWRITVPGPVAALHLRWPHQVVTLHMCVLRRNVMLLNNLSGNFSYNYDLPAIISFGKA